MNRIVKAIRKSSFVGKIRGLFAIAQKSLSNAKNHVRNIMHGTSKKAELSLKKARRGFVEKKIMAKLEFSSLLIIGALLLIAFIALTPPIRAGILTILNVGGTNGSGTREEVVEKRTEFAKVFKNPNGTYTSVIFATPIHYMNDQGEWEDIEVKILNREAAGSSFYTKFGETPSIEFYSGKTTVKLEPQNASPVAGKVTGNRIVYEEAYASTDLKYTVGASQVEEEIILKSKGAPSSFSFKITSSAEIPSLENDELNFDTFRTVKPFARDAKGNICPVSVELAKLEDGNYIILKAEDDWLREAQYPVIIDPTVAVQPGPDSGEDAYVDSSQPDTNFGSLVDLGAYDNIATRTRSYLQFDLSSIPKGSTISNASLQLYAQDALGGNTYLRRVSSSWDEASITWNSQPLFEEVVYTRVVDVPANWYAWEINDLVKAWASGKVPNYGIALMTSEVAVSSGGLFCSSDYSADVDLRPKLVIDYISDNTTPGSVIRQPKDNLHINGTTYTISGTATDNPDGSGLAKVQVSTDGGSTWYDATGTDSWTYTWNLPPDGSYNIRSRAIDVAGNIEIPSAGITVTVDNTPPNALIASPTGGAIRGVLAVSGTASDENFGSYKLQYETGAAPATWTQFGAIHYEQVLSGNLGSGFTAGLSNDIYTIQLLVEDKAGNISTSSVQIIVNNTQTTADPHDNYNVDTDTCALCHRGHTAVSNDLHFFPLPEALICYHCHDGMGTASNVINQFDSRSSHHPVLDTHYDASTGHFMVCANCHNTHGNKDNLGNLYAQLLRAKTIDGSVVYQGNDFCGACHGTSFSYLGGDHITGFSGSAAHDLQTANPASGTQIKCINCHEKHGSDYYRLNKKLEEELCYECHNSASLPNTLNNWDIQAEFGLPSRHDITSQNEGAKVECSSCHGPHVVRTSAGEVLSNPDNTKQIWTGTISSFCLTCHDESAPSATIDETTVVPYSVSMPVVSPISSPFFTGWNKSQFTTIPAGMSALNTCETCHHPHGSNNQRLTAYNLDNSSLSKEEKLCLSCHTLGGPAGAADINTQLAKSYKHPVDTVSDIHIDTENNNNLSDGSTDSKRHSECVDCHNPHEATLATASPPAAKGVLKGIGGIRSDGTPINPITNQYELCYKCHSSYVTLPPGELDKAYQFSTSNASFHPVEAVGKNTGLDAGVFVGTWSETSIIYCTDCHGNDDPADVQCVVGSANEHILKAPYTAPSQAVLWSIVPSPTSNELRSVYMLSSTDGWAVGELGTILHYDGTSWSIVSAPPGFTKILYSVYMVSSTDGWAVGEDADLKVVLHYDGTSWVAVPSNTDVTLRSVYMLSSTNGWAVGHLGVILHYDGTSWSENVAPAPGKAHLYGVSMVSPTDCWAVGGAGTILHYDGTSWSPVPSPTTSGLRSVYMLSSTDGWAVGVDGTIIHYDGTSWSIVASPTSSDLYGVSMVSSTDGWAIGELGTIIHYDGTSWSIVASPTSNHLYGLDLVSSTDGWAVGAIGTILQLKSTPIDTSLCFQCHAQESYSVGDPLLSKSRWPKHRVSGHQKCSDCHDSHGTNQAHLMNRGYIHATNSGTIVTNISCTGSGCHSNGEWISYSTAY